jgi:hypothetical protein
VIIAGCATTKQIESPPPSPERVLAGSRWNLTYIVNDNEREFHVEFIKGGILKTFNVDGTEYGDATIDSWEQDGEVVHLYFSNKFSIYEGSFEAFDVIKVTAENINNLSWEFELRRN